MEKEKEEFKREEQNDQKNVENAFSIKETLQTHFQELPAFIFLQYFRIPISKK